MSAKQAIKKTPAAVTAGPAPAATKAKATTKLQRHPLSEKFSLPTSEEERLALATDMEVNGQHQEIIMHEGMVLDGWERYMGCLQKGLTPLFKEYKGTNPAAVAFGANAIRRKLNSVQKALFGAKYFIHMQTEGATNITQKMVAKASCVSLQRLNEIVQLLRRVDSDEAAARCVSKLNTNPDITTAMLQTMLVDAGIVDANARGNKPAQQSTSAGAGATDSDDGIESDEDDDGQSDENDTNDENVDLLSGMDIDDLLGDGDSSTPRTPTPRGDKGNSTDGGRIGGSKRSTETPASAVSRTFRALTEPERIDFVKFAWAMLRPAVETCVDQGRIEWPRLSAQADAGKAALADVTSALAKAKGKAKPASPETPLAALVAATPKKSAKPAIAKKGDKSVGVTAEKPVAKWRVRATQANA